MPVKEYNVGDVVQIVPEPYLDCPFQWTPAMDKHCGRIAEIVSKIYYKGREQYGYRVDLDGERWIWCGGCFVGSDDEVLDISDAEFDQLMQL